MCDNDHEKENEGFSIFHILVYLIKRKRIVGLFFAVAVIATIIFYLIIMYSSSSTEIENNETENITVMSLVYHIPKDIMIYRMNKSPKYFLDTFSKDRVFIQEILEKVYQKNPELLVDGDEINQLSEYIVNDGLHLEYEPRNEKYNVVQLKIKGLNIDLATAFLQEFKETLFWIANKQLLDDAEKSIQIDYSLLADMNDLEKRVEINRYKERINEARNYLENFNFAYTSNVIKTETNEGGSYSSLDKYRRFIPFIFILFLFFPLIAMYIIDVAKKSLKETETLKVLKQAWKDSKKI